MGLSVATDGDPDFDRSVVVRNTHGTTISIVGPFGMNNLFAGQSITEDSAHSPLTAGYDEVRFLVEDATAPTSEALVECVFPNAGPGAIETFCQPQRK